MNIIELLDKIEEFRAQLENLGLEPEALLLIAAFSFVVLILSMREVLAWYLKINTLKKELNEINVQLGQIQLQLDSQNNLMSSLVSSSISGPTPKDFPLSDSTKPVEQQAEPESTSQNEVVALQAKQFPISH